MKWARDELDDYLTRGATGDLVIHAFTTMTEALAFRQALYYRRRELGRVIRCTPQGYSCFRVRISVVRTEQRFPGSASVVIRPLRDGLQEVKFLEQGAQRT